MNKQRMMVLVVVFSSSAAAGWWYWNEEPARVQAAISEVRDGSNVNHVMTVEAISEGGSSVVGRSVSILKARVTAVTGPQTLWIAGSEGEPLLILIAPSTEAAKLSAGDRISVDGVVRTGPSKFSLTDQDQSQLARAALYVLATEVRAPR